MREQDMPRTVSLVCLAGLTFAACMLNAFAGLRFFGISSAVTGFAFGGIQGIVPAIASEIFGIRSLATNYALLQLGPAFSALSIKRSAPTLWCPAVAFLVSQMEVLMY
jgi:hypothetical protein